MNHVQSYLRGAIFGAVAFLITACMGTVTGTKQSTDSGNGSGKEAAASFKPTEAEAKVYPAAVRGNVVDDYQGAVPGFKDRGYGDSPADKRTLRN